MNPIDPDTEQRNILKVLHDEPELQLREIHQRLAEMEESAFSHSPDPGNTWNDERHILRALRDILRNKKHAVTNDHGSHSQTWSLTEEGDRLLNSPDRL